MADSQTQSGSIGGSVEDGQDPEQGELGEVPQPQPVAQEIPTGGTVTRKRKTEKSQKQWEKRRLDHIIKLVKELEEESRWPPNVSFLYMDKGQVCFQAPAHMKKFCQDNSERFRQVVASQPFHIPQPHPQPPSTDPHPTSTTTTSTTTTTCTITAPTHAAPTTSSRGSSPLKLPYPTADMYVGDDLTLIVPKIMEKCGRNQHKRYASEKRPSWWPTQVPFGSPTYSTADHKKPSAEEKRSVLASYMLLCPDNYTVCGDSVIARTPPAPTPYTTTVTTPVTCTTTTTTRSTHSISTASSTRKRHMTPATHILTHTPNTTTPTTCTTTTLASSTVSTSVVTHTTPPDTTSTTVCTSSTSSTATMMRTSAPPSRQSIQPLIRYIQSMDELRCDGGHLLARVDGVSVYTPDLQSCLTNSLTPQVMDAYTLALLPTIPPLTQARTQYLHTGSCAHYLYPSIYPPPTTPVAFTHPNICGFFHIDQSCWLFMYASMERKLVTVVTPQKAKNESCLRVMPAFTKMLKAQGMSDQWDVAAIEGYHKFSHPSTGTLCLIYAEKYLRGQNCGENITSPLHALQHHILTTIVLSSEDLRWRCRMCCGEIEQDSTQHSNCCICRGFRNHYVCLNHHSTGKRAKWVCPVCSYF